MPIFYPPEWLQQQVTGPNPSANIGNAFAAFMKMAQQRQASAQDTLQMLLQSVPETGGQRASVAGELAKNPDVTAAIDPGQARLFRKRGSPTESQTVTKGFSEAYAKLPNKPQYDPAQLRETISSLSTAARESGVDVKPEQLSAWAGQIASGRMPQEPEFFGMMSHPQTKHLGLEILYGDLVQQQAREQGKTLTPDDVLAARKRYAEASADPQQTAATRLQLLQVAQQIGEQRLIALKERNKAITQGAVLTPAEVAKARADQQLITARLSANAAILKDFPAAAKGDQEAQQRIFLTLSSLSKAGEAGDRGRYFVLLQNALQNSYTPEMQSEIERSIAMDQETLSEVQKSLKTHRGQAGASGGASEGSETEKDPDADMADEILKALQE